MSAGRIPQYCRTYCYHKKYINALLGCCSCTAVQHAPGTCLEAGVPAVFAAVLLLQDWSPPLHGHLDFHQITQRKPR